MNILSIETSCDDTGIALIEASGGLKKPKFKILKNLASSQIKIHRPYGGVVPMLAKREHKKNLPKLLKLLDSRFRILDSIKIDLIAVAVGPGLEPALWEGINFAKDLAKKLNKSLIGTDHLRGHLYSFLLSQKAANSKSEAQNSKRIFEIRNSKLVFPAIALLVSGGHTILVSMKDLTHYQKIGETVDDAAGEAFDKIARLIGLPYPGGPELEKLAKKGDPKSIIFPRPMINSKDLNFSFSGLKTSVFYYLESLKKQKSNLGSKIKDQRLGISISDIAASAQEAIIDVLSKKTENALDQYEANSLFLSGGVAANKMLRASLEKIATKKKIGFFVPDASFNTDNAVMIAVAGYVQHLSKKKLPLKAQGNLSL